MTEPTTTVYVVKTGGTTGGRGMFVTEKVAEAEEEAVRRMRTMSPGGRIVVDCTLGYGRGQDESGSEVSDVPQPITDPECPFGDGIAEGDVVVDPYGFTWHRSCYDEEASVGTFQDAGQSTEGVEDDG